MVVVVVVVKRVTKLLTRVEALERERKKEARENAMLGKLTSCLVVGSLAAAYALKLEQWTSRDCGNVTCCWKRRGL